MKESGLCRAFESIQSQATKLLEHITNDSNLYFQVVKNSSPYSTEASLAENRLEERMDEAESLINSYNSLITPFEEITGVKLSMLTMVYKNIGYIGKIRGILRELRVECNRAIGTLESLISPIPLAEKIKLEPLKGELSKISTKIKDINFEKNLGEAISECENGHYLASWLIAGRVIRYIFQNIPGKNIDEKIEFLKQKEIITKDRKDVINFIIKADKETRDVAVHTISSFPSSVDAIPLIADCIKLIKEVWIKLEPIITSEN